MINLVRSEIRKTRSTQVWFWLLLMSLTLTGLFTAGQIWGTNGAPIDLHAVFTTSRNAQIALFILGVLSVTTEFRYQTITPTLLATPRRAKLVIGKAIAAGIIAAFFAACSLIVNIAVAVPGLASKHVDYSLTRDGIPGAMFGVFLTLMLYGLIGLGFGALVRNQVVGVVVGLLWILAIENLLVRLLPYLRYAYPFTPGGAAEAVLAPRTEMPFDKIHLLGTYAGLAILAAWAVVTAAAGARFTLNRDIT